MKYLVTSSEIKEYDNNTIECIGIPALVLMERAALAVRDEISGMIKMQARNAEYRYHALIAVGGGNNGADGLALARLLSEEGIEVSIVECGNTKNATESYKRQREILNHYTVDFLKDIMNTDDKYDFIVDGIFGVGLSRTVNEKTSDIIEHLNRIKGIKVAIDIPSGISGTTGEVMGCAFRADITVTFGFGKRGLYLYPGAEYAGKVIIAEIGINEHSFLGHIPEMFTFDESLEGLLPTRRKDGNKGTFGKVLLIAGWENMAGAAIMCAKAILQTGAGMVKVYCSEENRMVLQCAVPEAMYANKESLFDDLRWADVIVAGPGMGQSEDAAEVIQIIIEETAKTGKALLLDADALNLISVREELKKMLCITSANKYGKHGNEFVGSKGHRIIMTPHIGELSRLSGKEISYIKSHIVEVAKAASLDYDSVMVCKDARTLVYAEGNPMYLNITGNNGMATAGSGDVLAGIIGGLLAQKLDVFRASCVGVYLHGLAGGAAADKVSEYGVTATRIISQIEDVMKGS